MPELPEAETIVRGLRARLPGHRVTAVHVTHADVLAPDLSPDGLEHTLRGRRITAVDRRGKNVLLRFEGDTFVLVNLGMTGRLLPSDSPGAAKVGHVAIRFELDDGQSLLYDDVRRFGRIDLLDRDGWRRRDEELGLEPLSDAFTDDRLLELTRASRSPIRNWLLDQRRVAGIGNIYANEALFRARIHPARPAKSLSADEVRRLRAGIRDVLRESIDARGTTFRDFRDSRGEAGGFEPRLRVYGREGEPCPAECGGTVERTVVTNRSAFFCPECQR